MNIIAILLCPNCATEDSFSQEEGAEVSMLAEGIAELLTTDAIQYQAAYFEDRKAIVLTHDFAETFPRDCLYGTQIYLSPTEIWLQTPNHGRVELNLADKLVLMAATDAWTRS